MTLTVFLLQSGGEGNPILTFLPLIAIFVVFYFLLILPNQKRQKKLQQMLADLKNGDRVITSGGLRGTIISLKDDYLHIRVPPVQTKLEIQRSAVVAIEQPESGQS